MEEPLNISGVDRVVGYTSFENYIMQLSRGRMFGSSIFAVQLSNAQKVYEDCSFPEFRDLMVKIAKIISEKLGEEGSLLSYRGNGVFLCVKHGQNRTERNAFAQELNKAIADAVPGKSLRIIMGSVHSLRWVSRSGALNSLYKAVQDVEAKSKALAASEETIAKPKPATPYVPAELSVTLEEDAALEERAYKNLLRDILREEDIYPEQLAARRTKRVC